VTFRLGKLFSLENQTALITGGNSGIGFAMAKALGMAGACVILLARREAELKLRVEELSKDGLVASFIAADLAKPDVAPVVMKELQARNQHVDILVNAAGVNLRQPFQEVTADAFDLHMALHLRAPFLLTQALAPAMVNKKYGRIINLASLQSTRAFPNSAPYGAGKGGIVQLTRAIAEEWSRHGVTCNAIAPGFFPTPLTEPVFSDPARAAKNAEHTAIGRNGELDDLTGATVFLASKASAYITGQTLAIDGGFTAK
jgi:NAD(P)-dependent dehydrogenase (short-subunit alcohol dehydrogenase family)